MSVPSEHRPEFAWVSQADGAGAIMDGRECIASFYPGSEDLPEAPGAALRPVSLHDLRLRPGGPAVIAAGEVCGPLCLSWRKHLICNMQVEELTIDDTDPACFRLNVCCRDTALRRDRDGQADYRPGGLCETTDLQVTWESHRGSYIYDVTTTLTVAPAAVEFTIAHDLRGLEFGDLLPAGANDSFPPAGHKAYTHIVYRAADGCLYNRPQNRHLGPDKTGMIYAPDGFAAFVAAPDGNPVIEFVDGSGASVRSEICWAMYDLHLKTRPELSRVALRSGEPVTVHYRLYGLSRRDAAALLGESVPDPVLADPLVRCPVWEGERPHRFAPAEEYRQPSDRWFWMCSDPSCHWDWQVGRNTPGSLRIQRAPGPLPAAYPDSPWVRSYDFVSDGTHCSQWFYNRLPGDRPWRTTAMVRTRDLAGRAYLAAQHHRPGADLVVSDNVLTEDGDWIRLTLEVPAAEGALVSLFLVLEGAGTVWFDEVHVQCR